MKPGKSNWATNNTFHGGPNPGSNNKTALTTTDQAEGVYSSRSLSPGKWNRFRYHICERLNNLANGLNGCEIVLKDTTIVTTPTMVVAPAANSLHAAGVGCTSQIAATHDADYLNILVGTGDAARPTQEWISTGGEFWTAGAPAGVANTFIPYDLRVNPAVGHGLAGTGALLYSTAPTVWSAWTGSAGVDYAALDCDYGVYNTSGGRWCVVNAATGIIWTSATLGSAISSAGPCGNVTTNVSLRHSHHGPDALYPGSQANLCWMVVSAAGGNAAVRISWDGLSWTDPVEDINFIPFIFGNRCLDYSFVDNRWGMITEFGWEGVNYPTFIYSDSNGRYWTEVYDAFGWEAKTLPSGISGIRKAKLACSGYGEWMAGFITQRNTTGLYPSSSRFAEFYYSGDNGLNWRRVYLPVMDRQDTAVVNTSANNIDVWYHDGAFWLAWVGHTGSAQVRYVFSTLKVENTRTI